MKPIYLLILASLLLTGCLKAGIAPASVRNDNAVTKTDSVKINTTTQVNTVSDYDWYNGTKGTALIQVTCTDCTAIATVGDVTTPFIFNAQGVGQLKYTPAPGLQIYIAVCPGTIKPIKADIFDANNTSLYTFSGVSGNWNNTYIIK